MQLFKNIFTLISVILSIIIGAHISLHPHYSYLNNYCLNLNEFVYGILGSLYKITWQWCICHVYRIGRLQ